MTNEQNDATVLSSPRPAANLVVKQGPQIGILFPITANTIVLGREETCDIIVQDAEASRRHSQISWEDNDFFLSDLGSTNGTFINGMQIIAPTRLKPGDSIGVGQTLLTFELDAEKTAQADYEKPSDAPAPAAAGQPQAEPVGAAPAVDAPAQSNGNAKKWLLIGCGCLTLLCACGVFALLGLDLIDFLDLGIPGFSGINLVF